MYCLAWLFNERVLAAKIIFEAQVPIEIFVK